MVKRLQQDKFVRESFGGEGFNLHQSSVTRPSILVVLVHGLGGEGYRTWGTLPKMLLEGAAGPPVDVAVFDYKTLLRKGLSRKVDIDHWASQLHEQIESVARDYQHIFLVGHSLGGLVIEAMARKWLTRRGQLGEEGTGVLAALVLVASPRAGSGWAFPPLALLLPEFAVLRRLSLRSAEVDAFYSTYVDRHNLATSTPGRRVLPTYAVIGATDIFVSRYSATIGVPETQRLHLTGGHSGVKEPSERDLAIVTWLLEDVIAGRLDVIKQAARERSESDRPEAGREDLADSIVTALSTDPMGLEWEQLYNALRVDPWNRWPRLVDSRDVPQAPIDLILSVHDSELIVRQEPAVRAALTVAVDVSRKNVAAIHGICAVGASCSAAVSVLESWISPRTGTYVSGAVDRPRLRELLAELIDTVVGRRSPRMNSHPWRTEDLIGDYGNAGYL